MSEFDHHFLQKLTELVPYEYDDVMLGTLGLNIKYTVSGKCANPLDIRLNHPSETKQSGSPSNCQYKSIPSMNHIFTKRVTQTPFYISFMMSEGIALYILDFFLWKPVPIIYRIFYIQFSDKETSLEMKIPESHRPTSGRVHKIGSCYFNYQLAGSTSSVLKDLIINSDKNNHNDCFLVFAYCTEREEINDLDYAKVISRYNEVESISRMNNIRRFLDVQDPHIVRRIDTLWSRIEGLTPDNQPDVQLAANISDDRMKGLAIKEIFKIFGRGEIIAELDKSLSLEKSGLDIFKTESEPMRSIMEAYQSADPDEILLLRLLQKWWDRYSLPVYQLKFELLLEEFPEKLFMIYILAQWIGLPWSRLLLKRCKRFAMRADLEFLAYLHLLIRIKIVGTSTIIVKSGSLNTGNFVLFRRGKIVIRFTRTNQKVYSSLYIDQFPLLKIDKGVSLKLDEKIKQVDILPDVTMYNAEDLHVNETTLKADDYSIRIPLLWKKVELRHNDIRLRWIFKKNRFQFSCAKGKNCEHVTLNNQILEFNNSQWFKYYHPVKAIKPGSGINILDSDGRSYFLEKRKTEEGLLLGWIQNRYALFVEQFTYQPLRGKRSLLTGSESGRIESTVMIPDKSQNCTISTKKYSSSFEIKRMSDFNLSTLFLYSPQSSKGHLIAVIDDSIQNEADGIKLLLKKSLGFMPVVTLLSRSKGISAENQIIFITHKKETRNKIEYDRIFPSMPFVINFSEDIEEVFDEILPL